jgi:ribonuclease J
VSSDDGSQVVAPEIMFRGVPFLETAEADGLVDELREVVESSLAAAAQDGVREPILPQQDLHDDIAGFVYERLRRRPMVLPVVVEI